MTEIIEPGTKKVVKCNHCGCKFSYEQEDIKHHLLSEVVNSGEDFVSCPQCNNNYVISSTK